MSSAKLRLSPKEVGLVMDAEVILTKNSVIAKIRQLLEDLLPLQQELLRTQAPGIPPEVLATSPKISRGENYKGLPYLVLDLPRQFEHHNHFAIRTIFWWGHYFVLTLQLSGRYQSMYLPRLQSGFEYLRERGFAACISEEEWEHEVTPFNYRALRDMHPGLFAETLLARPFIKLSKLIPLTSWQEAGELILSGYEEVLAVLKR